MFVTISGTFGSGKENDHMSTIIVRGDLARLFRDYKDQCDDMIGDVAMYQDLARKQAGKLDVAMLAMVLKGQVQFTKPANVVFIAYLDHEEGEAPALDALRTGISAKPCGAAIITTAVAQGASSNVAKALALLFAQSHPKLVTFVQDEELAAEDGDDDDEELAEEAQPDGQDGDDDE